MMLIDKSALPHTAPRPPIVDAELREKFLKGISPANPRWHTVDQLNIVTGEYQTITWFNSPHTQKQWQAFLTGVAIAKAG